MPSPPTSPQITPASPFQVHQGFCDLFFNTCTHRAGQCSAVHTGAGLGSVSTGREETRGQRNSSRLGQLQAAETREGREGNAKGNPVAGEIWAPPGHPCSANAFPEQHPSCLVPPSKAPSQRIGSRVLVTSSSICQQERQSASLLPCAPFPLTRD